MGQVNWLKPLILASLLLILSSFAFWLEFKHKPEQETLDEKGKRIFALKDQPIESIRLTAAGKSFTWTCLDSAASACKAGENSKWKLAEPMQVRADDANTNSLVSALDNLKPVEVIDLKDESPEKRAALLKDYGLAPEALNSPATRKVEIKTPQGQMVAYIGNSNPINDNLFTVVEKVSGSEKPSGKVDATHVYLIASPFKTQFEHDLTYWRDKKVLGFTASSIESFELAGKKNGTITASRGADHQWNLKTPDGEFAGDIENVDALLTAASFLTAKNFAADDKNSAPGKAALQNARSFLTLTLHGGKGASKDAPAPIVLTLYEKPNKAESKTGKRNPSSDHHAKGHAQAHSNPQDSAHGELDQGAIGGAWQILATASTSDPVYELEAGARNQLDKSLKDLRLTKLIASMDRFNAKKLEFSGKPMGAQPLTLAFKDQKWVTQPEGAEVSNDKVQSTLDKLSGNRIQEFLSGSKIPAGETDGLKFTLSDDKGAAKRQLIFWKNAGKLYARDLESTRKEAFLVDSTVTDGLPWGRNYFNKAAESPVPSKK